MNKLIEFFEEYGATLLVLAIPVVFFISLGILIWYDEPSPKYKVDADGSNITLLTVDKHEYLVYHYNGAGGICHKVDCKFCLTRNRKD